MTLTSENEKFSFPLQYRNQNVKIPNQNCIRILQNFDLAKIATNLHKSFADLEFFNEFSLKLETFSHLFKKFLEILLSHRFS